MDLDTKARELLAQLAAICKFPIGGGFMSTSVYDTAWVSMVQKNIDGQREWLFPESFQSVLESQLPHGGWEGHQSELDAILNSLAALLALIHHRKTDSRGFAQETTQQLDERISRGTIWVQRTLQAWKVNKEDQVGFEILVPSHLKLLRQNGVSFDFPGEQTLMELYAQKMSRSNPETLLYAQTQTTFLHSLEAFVGEIDFDKLAHHRIGGSMLASPSSTAAYLIYSSSWDEEAEQYLRDVFEYGAGNASGRFPSAFPSTVFELSWLLSTLLLAGFTPDCLGTDSVQTTLDFLELTLATQEGLVGFAPKMLPDVDDTSRSLLSLYLGGRIKVSPQALVDTFHNGTHFRTFKIERNGSLSANCNALLALLHFADQRDYLSQISEAVRYICDCVEDDRLQDKWNIAPQYSLMLVGQVLMTVMYQCDKAQLGTSCRDLVKKRVPHVLMQVLNLTLHKQDSDGCWASHSCEVTAYAVLTLISIASAPCTELLQEEINSAINRGRNFLLANHYAWKNPDHIWVEKVTYASPILAEAYCLAALKAQIVPISWTDIGETTTTSAKTLSELPAFFSKLPLFSKQGKIKAKLKSALVESHLFLPHLRKKKLDIFPRQGMTEDRYLEYIPFIWIACNNILSPTVIHIDVLREMLMISMLNYQADEYMEVVGREFVNYLSDIEGVIIEVCRTSTEQAGPNGDNPTNGVAHERGSSDLSNSQPKNGVNGVKRHERKIYLNDVKTVLSKFVGYVLGRAEEMSFHPTEKSQLRNELALFLLAHLQQSKDNALLRSQSQEHTQPLIFKSPNTSFYTWVRGVSADHTSCPYSFVFYSAMIARKIAKNGSLDSSLPAFGGAMEKFLAADVARHLASLCRMYNDYGSVARDADEGNLNSVNFAELYDNSLQQEDGKLSDSPGRQAAKNTLFKIAQYERDCLDLAVGRLEKEVSVALMDHLRLFINVTDLFGQVYVARDIASRLKESA